MCHFKTLASHCSWAGRFESTLVTDPKDRFSRDQAHFHNYITTKQPYGSMFYAYVTVTRYSICIWAASWQNQQNDCVPSEDSDQPGLRPVWSVFAVRSIASWGTNLSLCGQRSLRWAHKPFCWFRHEAAHLEIKLNSLTGNFCRAVYLLVNWATTWQNQQNECAPNEDSDQPGHPPSLIRVFAVRSVGSLGPKLFSCGHRRLWSDWWFASVGPPHCKCMWATSRENLSSGLSTR